MKLIIEGPDNVGKSTLIRGILKNIPLPFLCMHQYAPPKAANPTEIELFHRTLYESMFDVFKSQKTVIQDRFYPGAFVYSKLYNRGLDGNFVFEMEEKYFSDEDVLLVILIDSPDNLVKREDGLSIETDISFKVKEVDLYKDFFRLQKLKNKLLVNVNGKQEQEVLEEVLKKIKEIYS